MTPGYPPTKEDGYKQPDRSLSGRHNNATGDHVGYGGSMANRHEQDMRSRHTSQLPPPRKDQSLSPFSKRLALTQAMNIGR